MMTLFLILVAITGKGHIPYSNLLDLGCTITGLPNGIEFKQLSLYTNKELKMIHNNLDNMKFIAL